MSYNLTKWVVFQNIVLTNFYSKSMTRTNTNNDAFTENSNKKT